MNQASVSRRLALAAAMASVLIPLALAQGNADDLDKAIDKTSQLVVMITDQLGTEPAFGAGIVFGRDKNSLYIMTANHVVRRGATEATNIRVVFKSRPDKVLNAKLLAQADRELDVAVLVLEGWAGLGVDGCKLPFDRLGNAGALQRGNTVYAIGNPNGENWRMPAPDRLYSIGPDQLQFQSAFIAVGSSGGALLNSDARIVGMVRRDEAPSGSAIPMRAALAPASKWGYPIQLRVPLRDDATPLEMAAEAGDIDRIKAELAGACSDMRVRDNRGFTPLLYAARAGQLEAVRLLIQSGANVREASSSTGTTALHFAAQLHDLLLATLLVNAGANVNAVSDYSTGENTPLGLIKPTKRDTPEVAHAKAELARFLIAAGADVNGRDHRYSGSMLTDAMEAGNHEMVKALIEAHADVNRKGARSRMPLAIAIESGDTETINLLIQAGADPRDVGAFREALLKKNGPLVLLMLKAGARPSDSGTIDVLAEAIRQGWAEVLEIVLRAGADVNNTHHSQIVPGEDIPPFNYLTPLEIAAEVNSVDMARILIANKADVNLANDVRRTALYVGACKGGSALIKLLLGAGASVNAADQFEDTPLHVAIGCRNEEAARALLQAGAKVDAKNSRGQTPSTLARGTPLEGLLSSYTGR